MRLDRSVRCCLLKRDGETFITLAIFLASLIYYLSYFNSGFRRADDPWLGNGALEVLRGRLPVVDFGSNYPPGRFYLLALLFRLFGPSLVVERLMWVPLLALVPVFAYWCACRFMPAPFALLPTIMVLLVPGAWQKAFFSLVTILNLWLIYRYLERRTRGRLLVCGLAMGWGAAFRHDVAGFAALAFLITLLLERILFSSEAKVPTPREALVGLSTYIVSATLAVLPFVVPYVVRSAADDLVYSLLRRPGDIYSTKGAALRFPNPLLMLDSTLDLHRRFSILVIYTPPLVALLTLLVLVWRITNRSKENSKKNIFVFLALLLLIFNYNQVLIGVVDYRVLQGGVIVYLLIGYLVFESYTFFANLWPWRAKPPHFPGLLRGGGLLLLLLFPAYFVCFYLRSGEPSIGTVGMRQGEHILVEGRRGGIYTNLQVGQVINALVEFVEERTSHQENIWVTKPYDEAIYFLTDRERPPYRRRWGAEGIDSRLSMVREGNPDWILVRESELFNLLLRPQWRRVYEYVIQSYHYEEKIGPYVALRRGSNDVSFHLLRGIDILWREKSLAFSPEGEERLGERREMVLQSATGELEAAVVGGLGDEYVLSWLIRAYDALGQLYEERGEVDRQIDLYKRALEVIPAGYSAGYHRFLGDAYMAIDALNEAIIYYEEAVALAPEEASYHRILGDVYQAAGRWEEAAGEYEKALALQPQLDQSARFHLCLGKAYREAGRREEAIREYERVLELEPGNVAAQKALASLHQ